MRHPTAIHAVLVIAICALGAPGRAGAAPPGFTATPAPSVAIEPAKPIDNYTILRLIVRNDRGEILLEHNPSGWMTPAVRANRKASITEALHGLARGIGIEVDDIRLAGLFTYAFDQQPPDPTHDTISFRSHYTATYAGGALQHEAGAAKRYEWVAQSAVPARIGMQALRMETLQILDHPGVLWGGAFLLGFEGDTPTSTTLVEPFYPLHE